MLQNVEKLTHGKANLEISATTKADNKVIDLARLYCDRGDFLVARDQLMAASIQFENDKNFNAFLDCQNLLLRVAAELEDPKLIQSVKEQLQDLVTRQKVQLTAKSFYTLALCASYKGQQKVALDYLEKALATALAHDDKKDICYAIYGLAAVYFSMGRFEDALKELYNLRIFFQVMDLPDMKLSAQVINGHILRKMGKFDEALELFWQSYESLKSQKNLYMYINILYAMGVTYGESGELSLAKVYLNLAKMAADPANMKHSSRLIQDRLAAFKFVEDDPYDLVLRSGTNTVKEKKKGVIDFKNQFVLLDLLRVFLKNPGHVFSKESLSEKVWKQEYDPRVHDNKIYVTIKRLRQMIEPDFEKPKYIFRAKNGYYLNKSARVYLENN